MSDFLTAISDTLDREPDLCGDCGETPCECPSCDQERPCKAKYESDDDLCCAHGGLCHSQEHEHYDRDEHADWMIDSFLDGQAERGRFR